MICRALVLVVALAALGGCSSGHSTARSSNTTSPSTTTSITEVSDCGLKPPTTKPTTLQMSCADYNTTLKHLKWRYWGPDIALAVGTSEENDCEPDCADGANVDYSINVVLWGVQTNPFGSQFAEATVTHMPHRDDDPTAQTTYGLAMYTGKQPSPNPSSAAPSPTTSPAALSYGGATIGMRLSDLQAAHVVKDWSELQNRDSLGCAQLTLKHGDLAALYDSTKDRVDSLLLGEGNVTPEGIKIGSSDADLHKAYPDLHGSMFDAMAAAAGPDLQWMFGEDESGAVAGIVLAADDQRCFQGAG